MITFSKWILKWGYDTEKTRILNLKTFLRTSSLIVLILLGIIGIFKWNKIVIENDKRILTAMEVEK